MPTPTLMSPEALIKNIVAGAEVAIPVPPNAHDVLKSVNQSQPGVAFKGSILDMEMELFGPDRPPRLAFEYIERAGRLHAECTRLRDRIEALQLDLFNYGQYLRERRFDTDSGRPLQREAWTLEETRLRTQVKAHEAALAIITANLTTAQATARAWPNDVAMLMAHNELIGFVYGPADSTEKMTRCPDTSGVDAAYVSDPPYIAGTLWNNAKTISKTQQAWTKLDQTLLVEGLKRDVSVEAAALAEAKSLLNAHLKSVEISEKRWQLEDDQYRDKSSMMGSGGELPLEGRLLEALYHYAVLSSELKQLMFAAEWGLEMVFGVWNETPWTDPAVIEYDYVNVSVDMLGRRLLRLSDAAYRFQLIERDFAQSCKVALQLNNAVGTGSFKITLPPGTDLALLRQLRLRGSANDSVQIRLTRTDVPAPVQGRRSVTPNYVWKPTDPAYPRVVADCKRDQDRVIASVLAEMNSPIDCGYLADSSADIEGVHIDRTMQYTSVAGTWAVTVTGPGAAALAASGLWVDVRMLRTARTAAP
jgi:hypothetical protein